MWEEWKNKNLGENYSGKVTFKKIFRVQSRKDTMDGMKPTPLRLLLLIWIMFISIIALNHYLTTIRAEEKASPTSKGENEIQLSFLGDIALSRYVKEFGETNGYELLFRNIKPVWDNSDLVFANLECVILDQEENYECPDDIELPATKEGIMSAINSGINIWALGNNHTYDYEAAGLACELEILDEIGLTYAGAGNNKETASTGCIITNGVFKIGFVSFTSVGTNNPSSDDYSVGADVYSDFYKNIRELSESTDLVVVYAHWGNENDMHPTEEQIQCGHRLVEMGADIVIGSHPHVLQSIEQYKDGIIFYSLGNFIFDQGMRPSRNTVVVQMNLDRTSKDGEIILIPVRNDELIPHVTDNSFYLKQIHNVLTRKLSSEAYSISEDGWIHIPISF